MAALYRHTSRKQANYHGVVSRRVLVYVRPVNYLLQGVLMVAMVNCGLIMISV